MGSYKLVWDDFCAWYLEMVKPAYQQPIDQSSFVATKSFFERILKLIHPFMPFLSEELWHDELFGQRAEMDCCIVAPYPKAGAVNAALLKDFEVVKQVISEIRNVRNAKQISPKEALSLHIKVNSGIAFEKYQAMIAKLANIGEFVMTKEKVAGAASFLAGTDEFFIPLGNNIDADAEKERISKELEYLEGFLKSVTAKLSNERFVQNAKPEIVANEQQKKADAEAKIQSLKESLATLN
jgi:valyl-tRNA synthetase